MNSLKKPKLPAKRCYLMQSLMRILLLCVLIGCSTSAQVVPTPTQEPLLEFVTLLNSSPEVRVSGAPFEVKTNNCGSPVSTIETFSRSREFSFQVELGLSQAIIGEIGGGVQQVAEAKLSLEVASALGFQVGVADRVETQRQVETPKNSITTLSLQWEEVWSSGKITVLKADGTVIGKTPFAALTTVRLTQLGVVTQECNSNPQSDIISTTAVMTNTNVPTGSMPNISPIPVPPTQARPTSVPPTSVPPTQALPIPTEARPWGDELEGAWFGVNTDGVQISLLIRERNVYNLVITFPETAVCRTLILRNNGPLGISRNNFSDSPYPYHFSWQQYLELNQGFNTELQVMSWIDNDKTFKITVLANRSDDPIVKCHNLGNRKEVVVSR